MGMFSNRGQGTEGKSITYHDSQSLTKQRRDEAEDNSPDRDTSTVLITCYGSPSGMFKKRRKETKTKTI